LDHRPSKLRPLERKKKECLEVWRAEEHLKKKKKEEKSGNNGEL